MTTLTFGTQEFIQTLQDAGVDEQKAKATATAVKQAQTGLVTTEHFDNEIKLLRSETKSETKLTRWMIGALFAVCAATASATFKIMFVLQAIQAQL